MDIDYLKILLSKNPSIIVQVLNLFNAHHINVVNNRRVQFGFPENRSGRSHCIFLDQNLLHKDYPNAITEDFIKMVARLKNIRYREAMNIIMLFLNNGMENISVNCDCVQHYEDKPLTVYDKSILDRYPQAISELFIKDGITPSTQIKFGIRFSSHHNRILIPIFQNDNFVGLFGRWNEKNFDEEFVAKYFPILPYQKGKILFPFDMNKDVIKRDKFVYLVESEKTPMLVDKWGFKNILALGGNCVKEHQVEMLKKLGVERVILALDKGLDGEYIEYSSSRLKEQGFDVYYIDANNIDYLPDKESVFDLNDKDLIISTIRKYIRKVD